MMVACCLQAYKTIRIPALLSVGDDSSILLAFAEGRSSIEDDGDVDIVMKRSEDAGGDAAPPLTTCHRYFSLVAVWTALCGQGIPGAS